MLKIGDNLTVFDARSDGTVVLVDDNGDKFELEVDPSLVEQNEEDDNDSN